MRFIDLNCFFIEPDELIAEGKLGEDFPRLYNVS